MRVLKLDVAKKTGWAIVDTDTNKLIDYGTETFWGRESIDAGSKVGLIFDFICDLLVKYTVKEIWMEQLNSFRNAKTVRSLLQQQSGVHLYGSSNGIIVKEIPTSSSYRKQDAIRMVEMMQGVEIDDPDICDAIMLNEKRKRNNI